MGKDNRWGQLGKAPPGHCHGCHKQGHAWQECYNRPKDAVPEFMRRMGKGNQKGEAHAADPHDKESEYGDVVVAEAAVGEVSIAATEKRQGWWIDSGASHNFTPCSSDFRGPLQPAEVSHVRVGDGRVVETLGMGMVTVRGHNGHKMTLTKVHLVPYLHTRLLSVLYLTTKDFEVVFHGKTCEVRKSAKVYMKGSKEGGQDHGLIRMDLLVETGGSTQQAMAACVTLEKGKPKQEGQANVVVPALGPLELAHQRMGHVAPSTLKKMVAENAVTGLEVGKADEMQKCEACMLGKIVRQPFPDASSTPIAAKLGLVHADMWGPVRVPTLGGKARYVLSLVDQATDMVWAYPLQDKESATVKATFEKWRVAAERQAGSQLKVLRIDNGLDFGGKVQH